jgi:DNA replication protein DnaC
MIAELVEAQKKLLAKHSISPPELQERQIDNKALARGGYPLRHRLQLERMKQGLALEMAKKHLSKILNGDALIILSGDRGLGKTQIATWWAAQRTLHGKKAGRYIKTASLIEDIKATWNQGGRRGKETDLIERYEQTSYLVLDEFHERGASDWEARTLINLIDHRYDAMKCTVIICNCKPERITQIINTSILDRANETGGLIYCDWSSYRTQQC